VLTRGPLNIALSEAAEKSSSTNEFNSDYQGHPSLPTKRKNVFEPSNKKWCENSSGRSKQDLWLEGYQITEESKVYFDVVVVPR
jgi:hypothetical protein